MSEWIMIIFFFSSNGVAITTTRFHEKVYCEKAVVAIAGNNYRTINAICVEDKK